jgi:hypothetical protein
VPTEPSHGVARRTGQAAAGPFGDRPEHEVLSPMPVHVPITMRSAGNAVANARIRGTGCPISRQRRCRPQLTCWRRKRRHVV